MKRTIRYSISILVLCLTWPAFAESSWEKAWQSTKQASDQVWNATKETSKDAWQGTKEVSSDVWHGSKEVTTDVWSATTEVSKDVWDGTKDISHQAWQQTSDIFDTEQTNSGSSTPNMQPRNNANAPETTEVEVIEYDWDE